MIIDFIILLLRNYIYFEVLVSFIFIISIPTILVKAIFEISWQNILLNQILKKGLVKKIDNFFKLLKK